MKRCLCTLVFTLLLTSIGRADQTLWEDFTGLIVGEWTGHGAVLAESDGGPLKRGDKFTLRASYRTAASGKAILGTQVLTLVDDPEKSFGCTVTFGWDPVSESIEVRAYWAEGAVEQISLREQKEGNFLGTYTILLPTGTTDSVDVVVKTTSKDKFAWTFASGRDAGTILATYERIHGTSGAEEYLAFWRDYFQGEWDTTIVKGEDAGVQKTGTKGVWICQPHPTQRSMAFSSTANGSPDCYAIAGYDPKSQAWKEVFFMADGSHLIQFYRVSSEELDPTSVGQVLKGQAEYIYTDGRIELADIGVKVLSRDSCEYFVKNRHIDGQIQPDLLFAYKRKVK